MGSAGSPEGRGLEFDRPWGGGLNAGKGGGAAFDGGGVGLKQLELQLELHVHLSFCLQSVKKLRHFDLKDCLSF